MATVELKNVSYVYNKGTPYESKALDNISLTLTGEGITGLIGHTGSGKSTMMQLINALLKPTDGQVLIDGTDIWSEPKKIRQVRFKAGLVMQYPEYQLFAETVEEDIAYGPRNMGLGEEEIHERVMKGAEFAGLHPSLLNKSPFELSGGQKRRAALAGVIAMSPQILILDEPAAGLDPGGRREILGGVKKYARQSGTNVIIVSHSMEDMAQYCDDVVVMAHAKVLMAGSRDEVFARADELEAVGLDIPQITKLMLLLSAGGMPVPTGLYTSEAAEASLMEIFADVKRNREGRERA